MTLADPKPSRVKDKTVYDRFYERVATRGMLCLHCGNRNVTAAHLLRGNKREDVLAGLIPLCGSGSSGCHGAFDSGHSYVGDFGQRVTPAAVKASVAHFLRHEAGQDQAAYLVQKLGVWAAEVYVQRLEGAKF